MRLIYSLICLLLAAGIITAQTATVTADELSKRDRKKLDKAIELLKKNNTSSAEELLIDLTKEYPGLYIAHKELAIIYMKKEESAKALQHLLRMEKHCSAPDIPLMMSLSEAYEKLGRFDEGVKIIEKLLGQLDPDAKEFPVIKKRREELRFRKQAYDNPRDITFELLPSSVNTQALEYLPALNAEGNLMIFTRRYKTGPGRWSDEDLYYTRLDENGNFSDAVPLEELNTEMNEGAFCYSPDGKVLIFASSDRRDSYGGFDLYISFFKKGKWTQPINMGPTINSKYWESQPSIANNNRTIYFSSTRPGGAGKKDIWKVELQSDYNWSAPINLGTAINTAENETSPYIHPDDKTLYFRSDGHIGLGDFDIFISRKHKDGHWKEIQNFGYPINTRGSEGALFVDLGGNYAYYASDAESLDEHLDIYRFELPEELKPIPVSYARFTVSDRESGQPVSANIIVTGLSGDRERTIKQTDDKGEVITIINAGTYSISVEKPGYIFYSEHIAIDSTSNLDSPKLFEIQLQKMPPVKEAEFRSQPVVLNNIFFETGSSELLETSSAEIDKLKDFMNDHPGISLRITGHTDNIGSPEDNQALSEARARAVYNALIARGIAKSRLSYSGAGETEPIADNDSPEGRQKNRRTEFVVIQN